MHGEVPNPLASHGGARSATLEGGVLALANAALAAVTKVQDLNSSTGDPPSQEIEDASAQAALLMDCCANMTHDLAVAERVATEVRERKEAFPKSADGRVSSTELSGTGLVADISRPVITIWGRQ